MTFFTVFVQCFRSIHHSPHYWEFCGSVRNLFLFLPRAACHALQVRFFLCDYIFISCHFVNSYYPCKLLLLLYFTSATTKVFQNFNSKFVVYAAVIQIVAYSYNLQYSAVSNSPLADEATNFKKSEVFVEYWQLIAQKKST